MINKIDSIYMINLPYRQDRLEYQIKQFESLGLPMFEIIRPVEVEDSKRFLNKSIRSCYLTHLKIIEKIIDSKEFCIILEDDAQIINIDLIKITLENLVKEKEWDMFYFYHHNKLFEYYTIEGKLSNTHAYIINPLSAKKIYKNLIANKQKIEDGKFGYSHIDQAYIHCVHSKVKLVHANQMLIKQNKNFSSDIEWHKSDS